MHNSTDRMNRVKLTLTSDITGQVTNITHRGKLVSGISVKFSGLTVLPYTLRRRLESVISLRFDHFILGRQ